MTCSSPGAAPGGEGLCVFLSFRHCRPVSAADCEPCRPRSINLWRTGFPVPLIPPCHEALGSVPPSSEAPPPENQAPPSYAVCTFKKKNKVKRTIFFAVLWFLWSHPEPRSPEKISAFLILSVNKWKQSPGRRWAGQTLAGREGLSSLSSSLQVISSSLTPPASCSLMTAHLWCFQTKLISHVWQLLLLWSWQDR